MGVITGRAYYNEVHIGDLIIHKAHRKCGYGSKLVSAVEETFQNADMIKLHSRHLDFKHRNSIRNLDISLNSFEKIKILNYASIFCQSESFDKFRFAK